MPNCRNVVRAVVACFVLVTLHVSATSVAAQSPRVRAPRFVREHPARKVVQSRAIAAETRTLKRTAAAGVVGSAAGLLSGGGFGRIVYETGICCFEGGDDPALMETVIFSMAGATLLSALAARHAADPAGRPGLSSFLGAAAVGVLPGLALGGLLARGFDSIDSDLPLVGAVLGFSVGQGVATGVLATLKGRED